MSDLRLSVVLGLKDQLSAGLAQVEGRIARLGDGMASVARHGERLGLGMAKVGGAMTVMGGAAEAALGAGLGHYATAAMDTEHRLRALGNTASLSTEQLGEIGTRLRADARATNQFSSELLTINEILMAAGMDWRTALDLTPIIGRTATATQAATGDLALVGDALSANLKIPVDQLANAFDRLTVAGEAGKFELKDMAGALPSLTAGMAGLGFTGVESMTQLAAALQIARRGAGSSAEAANNTQNFLAKLASPEVLKNFQKQGVDLAAVLKDARANGLDPFLVSLQTVQDITGGDAFKLGELFGDMQVQNFVKPMLADLADYQGMVTEIGAANGKVEQNFAAMMSTTRERWKQFQIALATTEMPWIDSLIAKASAGLEWLNRYPQIAERIVIGIAAVTAAGLGLTTVGAVVGGVSRGLSVLATTAGVAGRGVMIAARAVQLLGFGAALTGSAIGQRLLGGLRALSGASAAAGGPLRLLGAGMRTAMIAVRGLSVALLTNPIGLTVMAIAAAGLLIYKYWAPLKGFFTGLWRGLTQGLAPVGAQLSKTFGPLAARVRGWLAPLGAILAPVGRWFSGAFGKLAALFPPIGQAVSGVVTWFKNLLKPVQDTGGAAEAMGVKFGAAIAGVIGKAAELLAAFAGLAGEMLRIGGELIAGLINGITAKWGELKAKVGAIASGIAGTVKGALGIQSPSRVFAQIGQHLMAGLDLGLTGRTARVMGTVRGIAQDLAAVPLALAPVAVPGADPRLRLDSPADAARDARRAGWLGEARARAGLTLPSPPASLAPLVALLKRAGAPSAPTRGLAEPLQRAEQAQQRGAPGAAAPGAAPTITFSPTIHITGAGGDAGGIKSAVQDAMQLSLRELERLTGEMAHGQARRAYA